MRNVLSTLACLTTLAACAHSTAAAAASPTLRLVPVATAFTDGDPVLVRVEIANESSEALVVPALSAGLTYFIELRDGSGDTLEATRCAPGDRYPVLPAVTLQPGESLLAVDALAERFPVWGQTALQVSATYRSTDGLSTWSSEADPSEPAENVWKGTVVTPSVSITLSRPSPSLAVAIQELPGPGAVPFCLERGQTSELSAWLAEHGQAGPLAHLVRLKVAEWEGWTSVDEWVSLHGKSCLIRYGEYLRFLASLYSDSGQLVRGYMTSSLVADPFFGPVLQQYEPLVVELEALDAAWDAENE